MAELEAKAVRFTDLKSLPWGIKTNDQAAGGEVGLYPTHECRG